MAVLKRGAVAAPGRTHVEFPVASLGGSLIASSLATLGEQLALLDAARNDRGNGLPALFAAAVLDADGEPFWSAEQWSTWIASHMVEAVDVEVAVLRAWGMTKDAAEATRKN